MGVTDIVKGLAARLIINGLLVFRPAQPLRLGEILSSHGSKQVGERQVLGAHGFLERATGQPTQLLCIGGSSLFSFHVRWMYEPAQQCSWRTEDAGGAM